MAQKVEVKVVDDLDGSEPAGTVSFALDGRSYEIDLSDDNAARASRALGAAPWALQCRFEHAD